MCAELIEGCRKNQAAQQRKLFERLAPVMLTVCRRYADSRAEAEDMLQDAFVRVFRSFDRYDLAKGPLEAWVRRIVINTAIEHWRRKRRSPMTSALDEAPLHAGVPAEADLRLDEEQLLSLVAELPEGFRVVFNLYAIEGYNHAEIAEMLQITESASRSQLSRARRCLQTAILKIQHTDATT